MDKLIEENKDAEINFLPQPKLPKLNYLDRIIDLYANLYKIVITKSYYLYMYAVKFEIQEIEISTRLKTKIFLKIAKEIFDKYGIFIFTGESLFSTKQITEVINKNIEFHSFKYSIFIQPTKEVIEFSSDPKLMVDLYKRKPEVKTLLEIIIKDILKHNPSLKFVKNLYGKKTEEKNISASKNYNDIKIMPGFMTKVMFLDQGLFLNVDIKNKILSSYDCWYLIKTFIKNQNSPTKDEIKDINEFFQGRSVEAVHTTQRFRIDSVNFEKRIKTYEIKFEGKNISISKFYKSIFNIDLDPNSPLLSIQTRGSNPQTIGRFFPPQLCLLVGLSEEMLQDTRLLKNVSLETKLPPENKVLTIKDIIKLINEKKCISKKIQKDDGSFFDEKMKSSYEKKLEYGIDLIDVTDQKVFQGGVMSNPKILGANNKAVISLFKPFIIYESVKVNCLCIYHKLNFEYARTMKELFKEAGRGYGMHVNIVHDIATQSENGADWIKSIQEKAKDINIAVVLIDEYMNSLGIYQNIKNNAMTEDGYITQFVHTKSLEKKEKMSIMSNILIQINTKIGGLTYKIDFGVEVNKRNLMIIGVDSSRFTVNNERRTLVAVCATINKFFSKYTQKKYEVQDDPNNTLNFAMNNYIFEVLSEYFKINKSFPGGIVIYRQGVSREQKVLLKNEIKGIENLLTGKNDLLKDINIPFYYILVNKKSSLKLFEFGNAEGGVIRGKREQKSFENPDPGLLVYDKMTDPLIYEFYIQPQKVTSGSATPTNFHVAYGNLNCPEIIPKLTYDLCYLYSNWRGPVRVPAPLKYAEKLAKIPQKLNEKLKNTLSFI